MRRSIAERIPTARKIRAEKGSRGVWLLHKPLRPQILQQISRPITNGVRTILAAGGGGGGGGAGNVVLRSTGTITIDGSGITANGGNGGNAQPGSGTLARAYDGQSHSYTYGGNGGGGGVGGAGGSVFLQAPTVVLNAAITADGGMGGLGASGGTAANGIFKTNGLAGYDGAGGGGGRIAILTTNPIAGSAIPSASLGANASGRNAGHPTVYIAMLQLSNTPADYWPVNSLVTPQGNCNSGHVGCTVSYTATMSPTTGPFPVSGTVQFQLTPQFSDELGTEGCRADSRSTDA